MLRVASVGAWLVTLTDGISEESDETEVITASNESLLGVSGDSVDMGTIGSSWEDASTFQPNLT